LHCAAILADRTPNSSQSKMHVLAQASENDRKHSEMQNVMRSNS